MATPLPQRITLLAAGPDAAATAGALHAHLAPEQHLTIVVGTGDDITLHGLRLQPTLDAVLDALATDAPDTVPGEGGTVVLDRLLALGGGAGWFPIRDRDWAVHVLRSQMLGQGATLGEVAAHLAERRRVQATVLPATDVPVETHVVLPGDDGPQAVHVQQWRHGGGGGADAASGPGTPERVVVAGLDHAPAAPGVLDAIRTADLVVLAPGDPLTELGAMLGIDGVRDALRGTSAPVVGVSPVRRDTPPRPELEASMAALTGGASAGSIGALHEDFLDVWVVDPGDAAVRVRGVRVVPAATDAVVDAVLAAGAA